MWRSQERTRDEISRANEIAENIKSLEKTFAPLLALARSEDPVKALWQRHASRLARIPKLAASQVRGSSSFEEQLGQTFADEGAARKHVKAQERRLCTLRDFVVNVWRIPGVADRHSHLAEAVQQLTAEQMEHRREDRSAWLAWLKERVEFYEYLIQEKNPSTLERYTEMLGRVEAEIARVKTLSDEQILLDCSLFGENAKDFDPLAD